MLTWRGDQIKLFLLSGVGNLYLEIYNSINLSFLVTLLTFRIELYPSVESCLDAFVWCHAYFTIFLDNSEFWKMHQLVLFIQITSGMSRKLDLLGNDNCWDNGHLRFSCCLHSGIGCFEFLGIIQAYLQNCCCFSFKIFWFPVMLSGSCAQVCANNL